MTAQLLIGLGAGIIAIVLFLSPKLLQAEFARPRRHWLYFIDLTGGRSAMMLLLAIHI